MPRAGPSASAIVDARDADGAARAGTDFALVPLGIAATRALGPAEGRALSRDLGQTMAGRTPPVLGVGDAVTITVWEPGRDGLFSAQGQSSVPIQATVDADGRIFVPYIGTMSVAGMDAGALRRAVADGLAGKAVDPQVQVAIEAREGRQATLLGDVATPGLVPIPVGGLRLTEAVALAGGPKGAMHETEVVLTRRGQVAKGWMDDVLSAPDNDVWIAPRDTVRLRTRPRSFLALGAVGAPGRTPFGSERLSLAEAVAQIGGLNDNFADRGGVFIFRFESPERLARAGVPAPRFARASDGRVPVVYQVAFTQPDAFFVTQQFAMRDDDVLYVASAPAAEFRKFMLTFVTPIFSVSQMVASVGD